MTGITCHLYRAASSNSLLILSAQEIEYTAPDRMLRTHWSNIAAVESNGAGPFLQLVHTPLVVSVTFRSGGIGLSNDLLQIPLAPFGYPSNLELVADLRRFAPQIRAYLR